MSPLVLGAAIRRTLVLMGLMLSPLFFMENTMEQRGLKIGLRLLTVGCLMWAAGASAQVYVGGGVGTAKRNINCWVELPCDQTDSSYKLIGGYTLNQTFAIELNYANLGGKRFSYANAQMSSDYRIDSRATSVSALAYHHFTDKLAMFSKLGLAHVRSQETYTATSPGGALQSGFSVGNYDGSHALVGLGLSYKVSDRLSLRTEVEQLRYNRTVRRPVFQTVTVGAQYSF